MIRLLVVIQVLIGHMGISRVVASIGVRWAAKVIGQSGSSEKSFCLSLS